MTTCTLHPEVEASGICTYCGKPFCKDCLVEVDGKMVCRADVTRMLNDAKSTSATAAQPINVNVSNVNTNTAYARADANTAGFQYPLKSKWVALLLAIFLGYFGIHRFYVGKIGTGIIWLISGGLFGFGWLIDVIVILIGGFRDKANMPLK